MAAYEAIRDSFREFNRTLIDSQQYNAQHEISMADRQLKQTMLLNQLNQQEFNNRMAEERMGLLHAGNRQGAEKLAFDIENSNRTYLLNKANIEADNNRAMAQLKLEERNVNSTIEDRQARATIAAAVEKRSIKAFELSSEEQQLKNEEAQRTAAVAKASLVPSRVIIPPSVINNTKAFNVIKDEILTRWGGSIDENKVVRDRNGNEVMIPKHEQYRLNFKIKALEAVYDNKPQLVSDELAVLSRSQSKLQSTISSKKSIYDKTEVAAMKRQANVINAEIQERSNYLNKLATPEGQAKYKMDQAKNIRVAANNLNSTTKGDDPGSAKSFLDIADSLEVEAKSIMESRINGATGVGGLITEPIVKNGKVVGRATYDKVNQVWGFRGKTYGSPEEFPEGYSLKQEGETEDKTLVTRVEKLYKSAIAPSESMFDTLSGDTKNAISTLKNLVKTNANERGIDLSTESSYDMLIGEQKQIMIDAHNKLAAMYQEKMGTSSNDEFNTWVKEVYRPKLRKLGFEYDPKIDYREQIGQSD